jgi:hypothetical protein
LAAIYLAQIPDWKRLVLAPFVRQSPPPVPLWRNLR